MTYIFDEPSVGLHSVVVVEHDLDVVLGRPRNEKPFAVIPVGYPAEDREVPDLVRKSLSQVLVEI